MRTMARTWRIWSVVACLGAFIAMDARAQQVLVTFDAQGGAAPEPASKTVAYGGVYGPLATTARDGYAFAGWLMAPDNGARVFENTTVAIASDHTLYACWTPNIYTVTFDAQGGTPPSPSFTSVTFGTEYGYLVWTSRTGYTFDGWFTAPTGGSQVTDSTILTIPSDHTLYAHWTLDAHTVTFDAQGGVTPIPATKVVTVGLAYGALAATSRAGYTFAGWFTAPSGGTQVTDTTTVTTASDHTLYAQWTYTVTFDVQGGLSPSPPTKAVALGSPYGTLAVTSRTGYTLAGWFTAPSGGTQVTDGTTVTIASAHTLYAQWTANTYTVTFDAQGGTAPSPTSKTVTYGATYGTLPTTSREGYEFTGWFTAPNGGTKVLETTPVAITSDQTLYARWFGNTYTVTFDALGGTTPNPTTKQVSFGSPYSYGASTPLATTSRAGYSLIGWFTAASGGPATPARRLIDARIPRSPGG